MNTRTDLKSGQTVNEAISGLTTNIGGALQSTGEWISSAASGFWDTVSNPKFWTWPF